VSAPDERTELLRRIEGLEARLERLEARAAPAAPRSPAPAPRQEAAPAEGGPPFLRLPTRVDLHGDRWFTLGEGWLARAGVGLLLLGCILLFRYAVEQGWLTPELRLAVGYAAGALLLAGGRLLIATRRLYAQVLFGGGLALLFVTTLAGVELYALIPAGAGLLLHAFTVGLGFLFAARRLAPSIATVAALGGFTGPGVLLQGSVPGVAYWGYLAVLATACGALFLIRGWAPFLAAAAAAALFANVPTSAPPQADRAVAALAAAATWMAFAVAPLLLHDEHARRRLGLLAPAPLPPRALLIGPFAFTALLAWALAGSLRSDVALEASWALAAAGFALLAMRARRGGDGYVAACVSAAAALMAFTLAAAAIETAIAVIATLALLAAVAAAPLHAPALRRLADTVFALLAFAFVVGTGFMAQRPPGDALALAFVVAAAAAAAMAVLASGRDARRLYGAGAFVAVHMLAIIELGGIAAAPWLGSLAMGGLGVGAVVAGLRAENRNWQAAGMVSLGVLVIRLLIFDLATAGVGLRILLFMGFGVVFIGLGYLFRARRAGALQPAGPAP
jgi:uncharacterized membrane protein